MLFVSGERVERFAKAIAAGADVVCIDLEDAVELTRKEQARSAVLGWLRENRASTDGPAIALRINGLRTPDGKLDVAALADSGVRLDWLLVPKAESAADVQALHAAADSSFDRVVALIETPQAVEDALAIARAGGKLAALMLGGADLAAELGAQFGWDGLLYARGRLVNCARAAGLEAWDVPHLDLDKTDELAEETRRVRALGFSCKTAIHPRQIAVIHAAFAPAAVDVAWARALLQAAPTSGTRGAFLFQGRMVDAPVLRKAQQIVALADRCS